MSNVWENNILLIKADRLAHLIFRVTRGFPSEEKFGLVSQLRRAVISVVLNIIEGYSRFKTKAHINFLKIAYGSIKEVQYLIEFSYKETFISKEQFEVLSNLCAEVAKMLFSKLRTLRSK